MKPGRLSQTFWRRFVLRQLHRGQGEDRAFSPQQEAGMTFFPEPERAVAVASAFVSAGGTSAGLYALARAVNELEIRGAHCRSAAVQAILPLSMQEEEIGQIVGQIDPVCREAQIRIEGIQVTGDASVLRPLVQVTAAGTAAETALPVSGRIRPGQEILLCGYTGLEGSLQILDEKEEELQKRFIPFFLQQFREQKGQLLQQELIREVRGCGVTELRQIGSGGIFAALWEMAEESKVGLSVDMDKISIRQETVEICEYYRLNPYLMTSSGSFLIVSDDAEGLTELLEKRGARASRLGTVTAGNARIVAGGKEKRYLDRPAPDEVMAWHARG